MVSNLFSIVFFLGALQGLILALYLFFSRNDKRQAKYFLGFLILVLSYDMFETALSVQNIQIITTAIFGYSHLFTIGASVFLIIKTSINPHKIPRPRILLYYLPAIIDFIISLFIFALRYKQFFKSTLSLETYSAINNIHLISTRLLMVVVFWIYYIKASKEFQKFNKNFTGDNLYTSESEIEIIKRWLNLFLYVCFFIALIWTVTIFGVIIFDRQNVLYFYYPIESLLAFLTYWVGFASYHRIKIVYLNEQKNTRQCFNKLQFEEISGAITALSEAMQIDKAYLDPELTLLKIAARIDFPPRTISAILNQHMKVGFNEYVNSFRVEEVKQRLLNPRNSDLTILAIAFDSGFNSLAAFQKVFKNFTGITPKQFLVQNRQKS